MKTTITKRKAESAAVPTNGASEPGSRAKKIVIRGARVHNLKNISLELPRNKFIVVTGVSGSGKSSLAFDTLYAEGQRRFVESLSSYARQFLERMDKPDVDVIEGLSPAIAIEQRTSTKNPRSTVGTSTEIYDYLRLLFARIGKTYCSNCGKLVSRDTPVTVLEQLRVALGKSQENQDEAKIYVMFPMASHEGKSVEEELEALKTRGFTRVLYKKDVIDLTSDSLPKNAAKKDIAIMVDRLILRKGEKDTRLIDSIETAFHQGDGFASVCFVDTDKEFRFNRHFVCSNCGTEHEEPDPRMFSFNNPFGACTKCQGFGKSLSIDPELIIPDKERTIAEGAVHPWTFPKWQAYLSDILKNGPEAGLRTDVPVSELTAEELELLFKGAEKFDGINEFFKLMEKREQKIYYRGLLARYKRFTICDECNGSRLRPGALNVRVSGKTISAVTQMTLEDAERFFIGLKLPAYEGDVAKRILDELERRLRYLVGVGIGYLTLDRLSSTLSGGESQRINLSTALGSSLVGSLYVLDEPSVGLHPRDTKRLINILKNLRDIGNTVLVVEHDLEVIADADVVVDMGPKAGELGGEIMFLGGLEELRRSTASLTGQYMSGKKSIPVPKKRRDRPKGFIEIKGARKNNLKNVDVKIPLGVFTCITGVSGSGKSTLVHEILFPAVRAQVDDRTDGRSGFTSIEGAQQIDQIEMVDQSPIGRTPRSNPATYIHAFDLIRELFSTTHGAKIRGFGPGFFSFNVPGGRCEACEGSGIQTIEMQFLADLELTCEVCQGKRFKKEVLNIKYEEKNIDDVLNMTVAEAVKFFGAHATGKLVAKRLKFLDQVGMGYVRLGQSATTLSGGESQRVKLAEHLSHQEQGKHALFIFDEPTTGLHFDDIAKLLSSLNALVESGNTVVVIEHNMEVIKCADWVIDLGPEAGDKGGMIVAEGTPEKVAKVKNSYTGNFLAKYL